MAHAQGYSNQDFLGFTPEIKKHWLASTIDTLGFVAAYKDKAIGKCVWEWYFQEKNLTQKHGLIEAYMREYPDHSPGQVLIAITEKECGAYVR